MLMMTSCGKRGADFSDNFANKLTGIVERSALIRVRCCNREPVNSQYARYLSSGLIGLGDGAVRGNLDAGEIFFQLHQMEAHDAYAAKLNGRKQIIDEDRIMRALKLTPDSMDESDRAVMIDHLPTIYKPHWIRLFFGINYPEVFSQFLPQ